MHIYDFWFHIQHKLFNAYTWTQRNFGLFPNRTGVFTESRFTTPSDFPTVQGISPFLHGVPCYYTYTRESQIYRQVNLLERSKSSRDLRTIESNHRSHIGVMPVTKTLERVVVHPFRLGQNIGKLRKTHPRPA